MKLLWISHNVPYPPKTGVLQRNYNLIREAAQAADIYLVAFFQPAILPIQFDLDEIKRELGKICRHIEIVEIPTDRSKIARFWLVLRSFFSPDPYSVNWLRSKEMSRKLQHLKGSVRFDLVHFDTIGLAQYVNEVGGFRKVLNHHNIESKLMERRCANERNILKRVYFHREAKKLANYEREHCRNFDANLTVSELDKELLREVLSESRVEVIPNGVDTEYFHPDGRSFIKRRLVFIGGMNWYPNRDAIIHLCRDIWPLLKREIHDISLTVVGAQPSQELLDLAQEDKSVLATGFVDDVRPYLRSAELYICPMRDGGGTRLKILDALAAGTPIVSTTMGCEGIDVVPGKHVLLADTPSEFVVQVKRVVEDGEVRDSLARAGRRLVEEKYSWRVIGKRLHAVYMKLSH